MLTMPNNELPLPTMSQLAHVPIVIGTKLRVPHYSHGWGIVKGVPRRIMPGL